MSPGQRAVLWLDGADHMSFGGNRRPRIDVRGLSKRAAVSVREEISFLGPLKFSEIDAAQMEIIEVVKQLEAEGEIDLEEMRAGAPQ